MKGIVLVLALAVTLVSCQKTEQADQKVKLPPVPKVNTKEVWKKVKDAITSIKAKLASDSNVEGAKEETLAQLQAAAEAFEESMQGIGSNIMNFAKNLKNSPQVAADGQKVKVELDALGQCGNEVLTAAAEPLSEVVGLLTKKGVQVAKEAKVPENPPTVLVEGLKKLNATTDKA